MACCELVKINLTIILIQIITYAFDCAFDKSNVCGSHSNANVSGTYSNANALTISRRHLNTFSSAQHSNAHSYAFAFVNKPAVPTLPNFFSPLPETHLFC